MIPDQWASLEVRHLRAFATIVDAGSFAAAARLLGYSQPAISHQILALEEIVGSPLFVRSAGGRRPVRLTEAGALLLSHARQLLAQVNKTRADLARIASTGSDALTVVAVQSVATRILPSVLARFRAEHSTVAIRIVEERSREVLLAAVASGEADLGFGVLPIEGSFEVRPILSDPFVLVTNADRPVLRFEELNGERLLCAHCGSELMLEEQLLALGVTPAAVERFESFQLIEALVASGEGVGVVPYLDVDLRLQGLMIQRVPELPTRRLVEIVRHGQPSVSALDRFRELARDACRLIIPPATVDSA